MKVNFIAFRMNILSPCISSCLYVFLLVTNHVHASAATFSGNDVQSMWYSHIMGSNLTCAMCGSPTVVQSHSRSDNYGDISCKTNKNILNKNTSTFKFTCSMPDLSFLAQLTCPTMHRPFQGRPSFYSSSCTYKWILLSSGLAVEFSPSALISS